MCNYRDLQRCIKTMYISGKKLKIPMFEETVIKSGKVMIIEIPRQLIEQKNLDDSVYSVYEQNNIELVSNNMDTR